MIKKIFRIYGIAIVIILWTYSTALAQFTLSPSGTVTTPNTTFTMSGSVAGVSYQIRNSSGSIPGVSNVTGTGAAISFVNVPTSASGAYTVANSSNVQVAGTYIFVCLMPAPDLWFTTASSAIICEGSTVTFGVAPFGTPTNPNYYPNSYKWYNNNVQIAGQTASTLTVSTPGQYSVVLGFTCGNITLACPAVTAAITGAGTISPASLSIPAGTSSMQLTGTVPSPCGTSVYTYQWQNSTDQSIWTNIGGAISVNYLPVASATVGSLTYYRRVTYSNGTAIGNSNVSSVATISDCIPMAANLSANQNYISSSAPGMSGFTTASSFTNRNTCELKQTVQYIDGLGRPIQTIQVKASPGLNDIVQPVEYDAFNRESKKYLPYVTTTGTNDGSYKADALITGAGVFKFYNPAGTGASGDQQSNGMITIPTPYAQTVFEPSPLNRVTEQGAPGNDWQPVPNNTTGHTTKIIYALNDAADLISGTGYWAKKFGVNTDANGISTLADQGSFGQNQLHVTVTRDENWILTNGKAGTVQEYKDNEGRMVLKRTFNISGVTWQTLSTYYVYDDYGNLAYVLPPLSNADNIPPNQITMDNLCYQYRYDGRNRLTQKKLPGKGWEYIAYNKLDQPVLTQDANQRLTNQWAVSKYDALGRVIITGLWNAGSAIALSTLQASIYAGAQWDSRDGANNTTANPTGYILTSYPVLSKVLSINYYDDYVNIPGLPTGYQPVAGAYSSMTKGLPTATKTAVLNTIGNTNPDYLWTATYYDDRGRSIKTYKQHYLGGTVNPYNYDEITSTYNFTDQVTATTRKHYTKNTGGTAAVLAVTVANTYDYDHMGRKINTFEQIITPASTGANILLAKNDYNEIGQLKTKHLHGAAGAAPYLQDIDYAYNERGWLSKINNPAVAPTTTKLFAEALNYNAPQYGATAQYNGNIAEQAYMVYNSTTSGIQTVKYTYDKLNRLTDGTSSTGFSETGIAYDLGGNIQTLTRATAPNAVSLGYTYTGNQLTTVKNGTNPFRSYGYDANGNATSDGQSNTITYNLLNLPQTITAKNLTYTYDATGNKLRKVSGTIITDYISGIQYNGTVIDFIQTEEGRAINSAGTYKYEYTLTDHLGNNRVTFDQTSGKVGEDDYYPFGLNVRRLVNAGNKYLYNKKELQEELTQYDYGARFYDPVIGRWAGVDPLAEDYEDTSPYNYGLNNPIYYIDPNGMEVVENTNRDLRNMRIEGLEEGPHYIASTFIGPDGRIIEHRDDKDPNIYLVSNPSMWDGKKDNLTIAGTEKPGVDYGAHIGDRLVSVGYNMFSSSEVNITGHPIIRGTLPLAMRFGPQGIEQSFPIESALFSEIRLVLNAISITQQLLNMAAEHKKNARPSTKGKHQQGQSRRQRDRGGEKGETKPPRMRPPNWKGPWPPKK